MNTKRKKTIVFVIVIAAAALFGIYQFAGRGHSSPARDIADCGQLTPMESPLILPNERAAMLLPTEEIDFKDKEQIIYGKYGFRKEFKVEQTTIISQTISESLELKDVRYGVYHDSYLSEPVAEVKMGEVLKNYCASEMGNPEPYPDALSSVDVVLEPGTYYLAVYSTSSQEDCTVVYESWQAAVDTELELAEGQWGFFFSAAAEQKTYFKINVPSSGTIYVDRDFWRVTYDVRLCDDEKTPIEEAVLEPAGQKKGHQKAKLSVPGAGVYYLQVSSEELSPSVWANEVRYKFVSNK